MIHIIKSSYDFFLNGSIITYEPEPQFTTCTCIICVPHPPHYNPCATIFYLIIFYTYPQDALLTVHSVKIIWFLSVDSLLHIILVAVFLLLPPRLPHEWPKHVGGYCTINLHSYTQVYFWPL